MSDRGLSIFDEEPDSDVDGDIDRDADELDGDHDGTTTHLVPLARDRTTKETTPMSATISSSTSIDPGRPEPSDQSEGAPPSDQPDTEDRHGSGGADEHVGTDRPLPSGQAGDTLQAQPPARSDARDADSFRGPWTPAAAGSERVHTGATAAKAGADLDSLPTKPVAVPSLPTVMRGYEKGAVNDVLRDLLAERKGLRRGLAMFQERIDELETRLAEAESPTYAGLGGRASEMLRLAEEEAQSVLEEATREAAEIRARALADGDAIRADAERESEDMQLVQTRELEETRIRILGDAEQERSLAVSEAEDLRASAQREADQVRLAAQQEANDLRVGAKREAERVRAVVERETQESRRALAVERERLAQEAADHHESATAETMRLVTEAEARADAAEQRAREATAQASSQRQFAQQESEGVLSRARREAEQIVSSARKHAQSVEATGLAEAQRELVALQSEVSRMTKRRDAVAAQLGALRDVVTNFGNES